MTIRASGGKTCIRKGASMFFAAFAALAAWSLYLTAYASVEWAKDPEYDRDGEELAGLLCLVSLASCAFVAAGVPILERLSRRDASRLGFLLWSLVVVLFVTHFVVNPLAVHFRFITGRIDAQWTNSLLLGLLLYALVAPAKLVLLRLCGKRAA